MLRRSLAALAVIAALLAGLAMSPAAPPARAIDGGLEQACVEAGLARPAVLHRIEMHHAGLRPGTPHHWHSQGTSGTLLFPALPEGCAPSVVRTAAAQVQLLRQGAWINVGGKHGNMESPGNGEAATKVFAGPTHAWPDYVFNECVGGQWLKARAIVWTRAKDSNTKALLGSQRYVWPVRVRGSCRLARISKEVTAGYQEEWGGS